jgi:hypothetical protein
MTHRLGAGRARGRCAPRRRPGWRQCRPSAGPTPAISRVGHGTATALSMALPLTTSAVHAASRSPRTSTSRTDPSVSRNVAAGWRQHEHRGKKEKGRATGTGVEEEGGGGCTCRIRVRASQTNARAFEVPVRKREASVGHQRTAVTCPSCGMRWCELRHKTRTCTRTALSTSWMHAEPSSPAESTRWSSTLHCASRTPVWWERRVLTSFLE